MTPRQARGLYEIAWIQFVVLMDWIRDDGGEIAFAERIRDPGDPNGVTARSTLRSRLGDDKFRKALGGRRGTPKRFEEMVAKSATMATFHIKNTAWFDEVAVTLGVRRQAGYKDGHDLLDALNRTIEVHMRTIARLKALGQPVPLEPLLQHLMTTYHDRFAPAFSGRPRIRAEILESDAVVRMYAADSAFVGDVFAASQLFFNDSGMIPLAALLLTTIPVACRTPPLPGELRPLDSAVSQTVGEILETCSIGSNRAWMLQALRKHVEIHQGCFIAIDDIASWWKHVQRHYGKPSCDLVKPGLLAFEAVLLAQLLGFTLARNGGTAPPKLVTSMQEWTRIDAPDKISDRWRHMVADHFEKPGDSIFRMAESDALYDVPLGEKLSDADLQASCQRWFTILARAMVESPGFDAATCHNVFDDLSARSLEMGWTHVAAFAAAELAKWGSYRAALNVRAQAHAKLPASQPQSPSGPSPAQAQSRPDPLEPAP